MEERKFVQFKKEEFEVREFIKNNLGKGKISSVLIEYIKHDSVDECI